MNNSHLLEEVKNPMTGEIFIFTSSFNIFRVLERLGQKPNSAFNDLATGDPSADTVLNVLTATMLKIKNKNGEFVDITESEAREKTLEFIDSFGFMETSLLAQHMISKAMIGDEKKYKGVMGSKIAEMRKNLINRFPLMTFLVRGLLWVTASMIFGALGCWIFNDSGIFG